MPDPQHPAVADAAQRTLYAMSAQDGEAEPHVTLGSSLPKTRNDLPCFYYWRDAARDGNWFNAKRGFTMPVNPAVRQEWEDNFRRMKAAGDEVPVVKDHKEDADSTLGYVVDVKNDGDRYRELHQYLGNNAKETALRNKISVGVDPNYIDSKKQPYGQAVVHSAVTSRPAIPGETDAIRVASRHGGSLEIITLSKADDSTLDPSPAGVGVDPNSPAGTPPPTQELDMGTLKCSKETLDALHKHVPGLADAADDDKLARVAQHLQTMSDADADDAPGAQNMSAADLHDAAVANRAEWKASHAELATVKDALVKSEGKVQEMSKAIELAKLPEPDPLAVRLMSRSLDTERESVIASGVIDANTAKQLDGLLRTNGKPNVLAMSRTGADEDPLAFKLWTILKANQPKLPTNQAHTGIQAMSRVDPDTSVVNEDTTRALKIMADAANGVRA